MNTSEIAAECITMCGITDIADAVATRIDKFIRRYLKEKEKKEINTSKIYSLARSASLPSGLNY